MEDIFESLFMKILNMSLTASYIIAAVLIVRLLLRKAPKKYSYALWAVAGFRLVCPVSFKSIFSIFALKPFALRLEDTAASSQAAQIVHIPENIGFAAAPEVQTGLAAVDTVINESLPAATPYASVNPMQIWIFLGMLLWMVGIIVLLTVSAVSLFRLHRRIRTATLLEGNVWQSENVHSPFIVGIFRPKIYIPYGLSERQLEHVLAHERCHIKRLDHIVRTLSYLVLCLHWFNPLVWLAFHLMGRDMELSCDEKVLSRSGDKAEYSETLLSFAYPRRFPTPTPLAFGESSVAQRIKNALKWHKPKFWVSAIALVCCLAVIAACAANPRTEQKREKLDGWWVPVECVYMTPVSSYFPFGGDNGYIYEIGEDGLRIFDQQLRAYDHQNGQFRGGYASGYGWEKWFDFPYTAEEWDAMFPFWIGYAEKPLSGRLDDVEYMPLIGNDTGLPFVWDEHTEPDKFFLRDDDELWIVDTVKDSKGQRSVGSIYALQRQDSLGVASFEYPDGTSNEPGIEIVFDTGKNNFNSVSATAYGGQVWANLNGERCTPAGTSAEVPALGSLFWSPVQNENERPEANGFTKGTVMRLRVDYGWSTTNCNIYIKYDYDKGVYELRPVGKGVYMGQSEDGKAILSLDPDYAHAKASDTDLAVTEMSAASPWEFLSGLSIDRISGIMIHGDPAAVENVEDPVELVNEVVAALNKVGYAEIYAGRGAPNQYAIGFNYDNDASYITLGYCSDFVELRLQGEAAEAYPPTGGPVWEIHNDALTELMGSLIRPVVTSFEFSLDEDGQEKGVLLRFDPGDFDDVAVMNYFLCFPDETGTRTGGSATGNPIAERWKPDEMLTEKGRALAESGGILVTVRKGNGYVQGQLVFEGTAIEKDAKGLVKSAEYKIYLEGPFTYALSDDGREVTLGLDEDWLKPTPVYMLSQLKPSHVTGFELSGQLDGRIISAGIRDREIVDILSSIDGGELKIVQDGAFFTEECRAVLQTESGTIILSYGNGETRLSFEGGYSGFSEIAGTWATKNEALCGLFYELLLRYAEKPELPAFTIDFTNHSEAEATKLIVTFANNPEANFKNGGYSAQSSITRGGYTDSRDIEPMEKGRKYSQPLTVQSMGIVPSFETVYIAFELDGRDMGTYGFAQRELCGSTVDCTLDETGNFSVALKKADGTAVP